MSNVSKKKAIIQGYVNKMQSKLHFQLAKAFNQCNNEELKKMVIRQTTLDQRKAFIDTHGKLGENHDPD